MKKLFLLLLLAFVVSCQPSRITGSWAAKDIQPRQYKKILVLGVLTDNDIELQSKIENHLADDLKELGYNSIAANKVFPPGTFIKGDSARAKAAIEGKGFDGILTVVLLNKEKEQVYLPGKIYDNDYYNRYGRFDRYMTEVNEKIYTAGYYAEQTKYIWENNFYDLGSRRLIYTARTSTFDIASKTTLAHTYGQLMVQSLINKKIILKYEKKSDGPFNASLMEPAAILKKMITRKALPPDMRPCTPGKFSFLQVGRRFQKRSSNNDLLFSGLNTLLKKNNPYRSFAIATCKSGTYF